MRIVDNTHINFKSRACPVKPYYIKTKYGKLFVEEAQKKDIKNKQFSKNLALFFCKNFASMTKDPSWLFFNQKSSIIRNNLDFQGFADYIRSKLLSNDNSLTMLLARDKNKRIQGACFAYKYDGIPSTEKVYYIDSIAVNKPYRKFGVASSLLNKTIHSVRNTFTDAFLTGDLMAEGFYKKMGFEPLNPNHNAQKVVIDYISRERLDYPKYIDLFTKPLKIENPRWYTKAAKIIENECL